jgi:hypothetical protein
MPACVICIAQIGMSIALLCKEGGMDDSKMSGIVFIIGTAILILLVMVQQCFRIPVLMDVFGAVFFASNLATVFIYCFTKYPRASSTSSSLRLLQPDTTSESTLDIVREDTLSTNVATPRSLENFHQMAIVYIWYTLIHYLRGNWCYRWLALFVLLIATEVILQTLLQIQNEYLYTYMFLIPLYLYFFIDSYLSERAALDNFLLKRENKQG